MRNERNSIELATLIATMAMGGGLEFMLGLENSVRAQSPVCEGSRFEGRADSQYLYIKRAEAANVAKDAASAACDAFCAPLDPCSENKPHCKGHARTNAMTCNRANIFGVEGWTCYVVYTCTCGCSRESGSGSIAGTNVSVDGPVSDELLVDLEGGAQSASGDNPFEGSWTGTYEVAEFDSFGIVEFDVSERGVLNGVAFNEEGGYGRNLVATIDADGSMRGAAVPLAAGTVGEPFSGYCFVDDDGTMVCDLSGCVQGGCFELLVTVQKVDSNTLTSSAAQGDAASLIACDSASFQGTTSGAGRTRSAARQEAFAFASAYCNGTCGQQEGCSNNKPNCKGIVKLHDLVWEGPTTLGRIACSGAFTCTCSCAR